MSTALKRLKRNKRLLTCLLLLLLAPLSAGAEGEGKESYYWVRIGDQKADLASIQKSLSDLPDEIERDNLRVCMIDGRYALVHFGGEDADSAYQVWEKLSQKLGGKIWVEMVTYDQDQCFSTAYFLLKPSGQNQSKNQASSNGEKEATDANPPIHIYPNTSGFSNQDEAEVETTDGASALAAIASQVLPEVTTQVSLSNLDINRITCMGDRPVKDVVYSVEKGITVEVNGSNAFIKLQMHQDSLSSKAEVIEDPVELYVVCGNENEVYTLIGVPKKIPAQWVQLASKAGSIKKNQALFEGKAFEKKIITLIKHAWKETYPDSYAIENVQRPVTVKGLEWLDISLRRVVTVEGEGFVIKEYALLINSELAEDERKVLEKQFIAARITDNPLAISLDSLTIKKDAPTRLFVIERSVSESGIGIGNQANK